VSPIIELHHLWPQNRVMCHVVSLTSHGQPSQLLSIDSNLVLVVSVDLEVIAVLPWSPNEEAAIIILKEWVIVQVLIVRCPEVDVTLLFFKEVFLKKRLHFLVLRLFVIKLTI